MNNNKKIRNGFFVMTVLTLSFVFVSFSDAATYQFINTSDQISNVTANTPQEALTKAYRLGLHSGVMLVGNNTNVIADNQIIQIQSQGQYRYLYINNLDQMVAINANTSTEAFAKATNISTHSGVMLSQ